MTRTSPLHLPLKSPLFSKFPHRPSGDFLITPHPAVSRTSLVLATGGSGHAFKFLPVIGDCVVDLLEGRLDPELEALWGWRRKGEKEEGDFVGTEDGFRGGEKGLLLGEEPK